MKTIKITADGTVEQVEINGYDELKGHLDGGYLEGLHLTDDASAFIDEEGKIKGLPFNAVPQNCAAVCRLDLHQPTSLVARCLLLVRRMKMVSQPIAQITVSLRFSIRLLVYDRRASIVRMYLKR